MNGQVTPKLAALPERSVVEVAGEDRVDFLQGLVSNDVTQATREQAAWAALLTPQGKWLADFFIVAEEDRLLLDCERDQADALIRRLSRFRLRSRATVKPVDDLLVYAAWGGPPHATGIAARDPRLPQAGWRVLTASRLQETASHAEWDCHRLQLGLPDGSRDLEPEKTVLLEAGFDELNGVSWSKGCYMGQELTARTKYRGLVKRRLVPVEVTGPLPDPGTPVMQGEKEAGAMRSGCGQIGLATLRLDALSAPLSCGGSVLVPKIPSWMRQPEAAGD
jgi:folate-binding protein YgfZ